ncbi:conserved hypothetical protein [Lebetimonas natsushimae]|uniref:Uncharacterized protein n=1 Tax=Lebetimonas natsushimae TaxID=1936991 RepID=A0A292YC49_9BACT|nr:hypothetical protein [Lebetimonas natsushimae]GAX87073.1 conserved hypothetical protein [Lebetimonas natsushimae]
MVIIAFTFSVIPKIIEVSNKSLEFSKKEDAIFNMMSKAMDISLKEYDEENTKYDDILLTGNSNVLECNISTNYRTGGFKGGRNCINHIMESDIGSDSNEPPFDDVDDYNGYNEKVKNGHTTYDIHVTAGYTDEWNSYNNDNLNFIFTNRSNNTKTNIKRIEIKVSQKNHIISSVKYYSANIGHIKIGSVLW